MSTLATKKTQAEIKVLAINTLYEYAEKYIAHEKARLSAFIGLDIFKVDGSFKAKYDAPKLSDKLQLPDGTWVDAHYWFNSRNHGLDINVKVCVNGGSYDDKPATAFCEYQEQSFTLFNKEDGKLVENNSDRSFLKKRYNVDEVTAIANEVKEAAKQFKQVADKMPYLFYDTFYLPRLSR